MREGNPYLRLLRCSSPAPLPHFQMHLQTLFRTELLSAAAPSRVQTWPPSSAPYTPLPVLDGHTEQCQEEILKTKTQICPQLLIFYSLGLFELLLPSQLLHFLNLLGILLLHQFPVGLHAAVALTHKGHQLSHQIVALLSSFFSSLFVLLLHGPLLPAIGGLPRIVLLLPSKVFASAEALPVAIKHMHYL